jgi:peroxiredoxin
VRARAKLPAAVVASVVALLGCGAPSSSTTAASAAAAGVAPDFELATLSGGRERLSDHRGKDVVLIDFWATFCEPCLLAMPELDALYRREHARGFVVFGISIDEAASVARVRGEASKLGVSFPILLDQDTRVVSLYNPRATAPYSVLVARDGTVVRRQEGYTTSERENLEHAVEEALAK